MNKINATFSTIIIGAFFLSCAVTTQAVFEKCPAVVREDQASMTGGSGVYCVILISANAEWRPVKDILGDTECNRTPYGDYCEKEFEIDGIKERTVFFHSGWGKVDAAGSTQYAIDRWNPKVIVNLGTCGGFEGKIERNAIILVNKTVIYDIIEQMGNSEEAIDYYTTSMDLSFLKKPYPTEVMESILVSADRDLIVSEIPQLIQKYDAVAGDWESGAIAFVAKRNHVPCLILRAVSDLVSRKSGEAYGNYALFEKRTRRIMQQLLTILPLWLNNMDL